jgi:hypothetical protein
MKNRLFYRRCSDMDAKFQQFSPHLKVEHFRMMLLCENSFTNFFCSQAVMEGRGGLAMGNVGVQSVGGAVFNASRGTPDNWMKQQQQQQQQQPVIGTSESKSAFMAKGMQKGKPPSVPQQQQSHTTASMPSVNHLFGSDGCLRSHLIQEVIPVFSTVHRF